MFNGGASNSDTLFSWTVFLRKIELEWLIFVLDSMVSTPSAFPVWEPTGGGRRLLTPPWRDSEGPRGDLALHGGNDRWRKVTA